MNWKTVVICLVTFAIVSTVLYISLIDDIEDYLYPLKGCDENVENCVRFCSKTNESYFDIKKFDEATYLSANFSTVIGYPCEQRFIEDFWMFYENGSIKDGYNDTIDTNNYCVKMNETSLIALTCVPANTQDKIQAIFPYLMMISVPFLVITFFVYGCVRELRNLHGKCLMCYVLSLAIMYSSLAIIQLKNHELLFHQKTCKALGYILFSSILMCFFWINVLCYDIFCAFRGKKKESMKKFIFYCIYAIIIPIFIVTIVFILNEYKIIPEDYNNQIGTSYCFLSDNTFNGVKVENYRLLQLIYIYIPISIFLTINICFYSITAYRIYQVQKESAIFKRGESSRHTKMETIRFFLYVRLFVIMGIPWIIEIISWTVQNSIIFIAASTVNCLQGFIIFMLFVWQNKVQKIIERKYSSTMISTSKRTQVTKTDSSSSSRIHMKHIPSTNQR